MTRKEQQRENILQHGRNLIDVFPLPADTDPLALCKRLHRLETRAHRLAEAYCNGELSPEDYERQTRKILDDLDKVLHFRAAGVPVFFNGDPRGYALKIEDDYVRAHNLQLHRDWGGYGIICPEY